MYRLELLLRGLLGGALIVLITFLAESKYTVLAGIMVLFPVITLVSYYFIGSSLGMDALQKTVASSILSLPVLVIYLISFHYALKRYSLSTSVAASLAVWIAAAAVFYALNNRYHIIELVQKM